MNYWYGDNPNCGRCGHLNGQGFCSMTACIYPVIESSTLVVKPQTNYDRIISKSPEELAAQIVEWIEGIDPISGTLYDNDMDGWLDWLKQEVGDG